MQLSKRLTCLYDCIYVALKAIGFPHSFEAVTSAIGFSIEANIKARNWVLCGQSDIDYYSPQLNRGVVVNWRPVSMSEFERHLASLVKASFPLIVETESMLVPYYSPGSIEIGMPHAFIIFAWNQHNNTALIYDRLAPLSSVHKTEKNLFEINLDKIRPALEKRINLADISIQPIDYTWEEEIIQLLKQSIVNMEKKVSRSQSAYQAFGLEAIDLFYETLTMFNVNYHDDVQSVWLLSHHLPLGVFQSVHGNRFLFKKMLDASYHRKHYIEITAALTETMNAWSQLRKEFALCANGESTYSKLGDNLMYIRTHEERVILRMKEALAP